MKLMLPIIFACVAVGLLGRHLDRRHDAAIAVLAFTMTALYLLLSESLM